MKNELSLQYLCENQDKMYLLQEWDWTRNVPLTPDKVSGGSHQKVWWRCSHGHTWQSAVRVRAHGAKCPYCSRRILWVGDNDLATVNPALAAQWDVTKNGALRPSDVLAGSQQYVWWRCENGHSWRASVLSRTRGSGCPICSGKTAIPGENDLLTLFPNLAAEWNAARNGRLTPEHVTPYSNKKVWWQCALGHEWQAVIASRAVESSGCPYCTGRRVLAGFNDLATLFPKLAAQWDDTLNGGLTPEMVTPGSHKRIWWKCSEGHVWKAVVYSRTGKDKCGCPVCAGRTKQNAKYAVPEAAAVNAAVKVEV